MSLFASLRQAIPVRNQQLSGEPTRDRRKLGGRRSAAAGFEQSRFRPRGREAAPERLEGFCRMLAEALAIAGKDLARLILARELMTRATAKCRRNSSCPSSSSCSCRGRRSPCRSRPSGSGSPQGRRPDARPARRRLPTGPHRTNPRQGMGNRLGVGCPQRVPRCRRTAMLQGGRMTLPRRMTFVRGSWEHPDRSGLSPLPAAVQGPAAETALRGRSGVSVVPA